MSNFLDYRCPACGDRDHIDVAASVWVRLTADGSDADAAEFGDHEYTPGSLAVCRSCDYDAPLREFEPEPQPLTLDEALQQALAALNTAPCFKVPSLDTTSYKIAAHCERAIKSTLSSATHPEQCIQRQSHVRGPTCAVEFVATTDYNTKMAIDVLSYAGFAPIIVGDVADMSELQGVSADAVDRFHLLLNGQKVSLSLSASDNFRTATHLLMVGLTDADKIVTARKARIDNLADGRDLSADERHALTKALTLGKGSHREFYTKALAEFRRMHPDLASAT